MASVHCESNVSIYVNEEEKNVLQESHDILEKIRHYWSIRTDDAWDDERYWDLDNAINMLQNLFGCKKSK